MGYKIEKKDRGMHEVQLKWKMIMIFIKEAINIKKNYSVIKCLYYSLNCFFLFFIFCFLTRILKDHASLDNSLISCMVDI